MVVLLVLMTSAKIDDDYDDDDVRDNDDNDPFLTTAKSTNRLPPGHFSTRLDAQSSFGNIITMFEPYGNSARADQ